MPTSTRQYKTDFMEICGKFVSAQRADVGIGPYYVVTFKTFPLVKHWHGSAQRLPLGSRGAGA